MISEMSPTQIVTAGLWADYAALANAFVRVFDCPTHDVARTWQQMEHFITRFEVLFVDLHVLNDVPPGAQGETMTSVAISQAKGLGTLQYGSRILNLWPEGSSSTALSAVAAVRDLAAAAIDRVRVEMREDSVWLSFVAFDLNVWWTYVTYRKDGDQLRARKLREKLHASAKKLGRTRCQVETTQLADELCLTAVRLAKAWKQNCPAIQGGSKTIVASGRENFAAAACPRSCHVLSIGI